MIELISREMYEKVKDRYEKKIIIVIPFNENRVKELKEKIKIIKVKKGMFYDFSKRDKYKQYDYFLIISLTDISNKIFEVEKRLKEMVDGSI